MFMHIECSLLLLPLLPLLVVVVCRYQEHSNIKTTISDGYLFSLPLLTGRLAWEPFTAPEDSSGLPQHPRLIPFVFIF